MGTQTDHGPVDEIRPVESVNVEDLPEEGSNYQRSLRSELLLDEDSAVAPAAKIYKRRWFGLLQLVLMNTIISWAWLTYSPISGTAAQVLQVDETDINWLSIGFLFAFGAAAPLTIWIMNRFGPKASMVVASILALVGNWTRFVALQLDEDSRFAVTAIGQGITGLSQPFVLSAPVRYADLWFPPSGRVTATALATLANPAGGAIAQLVGPIWVSKPSQLSDYVLFISCMSSAATIPSLFVSAWPPNLAPRERLQSNDSPLQGLRSLIRIPEFSLVFVPFTILIGVFTAISSLLNEILQPHGFTETEAGITGAILILTGLAVAAIISPVIDRTAAHLLTIKVGIPLLALAYVLFLWIPSSGEIVLIDMCAGIIGALSFSLLPIGLEFVADVTHPISTELSSTLLWTGGQLLGGTLLICMGLLKAGSEADVPMNLDMALVIPAALAVATIPCVLALGLFGRQQAVLVRRVVTAR